MLYVSGLKKTAVYESQVTKEKTAVWSIMVVRADTPLASIGQPSFLNSESFIYSITQNKEDTLLKKNKFVP